MARWLFSFRRYSLIIIVRRVLLYTTRPCEHSRLRVRIGRPEAEPAVCRRKELFVNIIYTRPKRDTRSQKCDKSWPRALIPVVAPSFNWTRNIYYHFMRFASKTTPTGSSGRKNIYYTAGISLVGGGGAVSRSATVRYRFGYVIRIYGCDV